MNNKIVEKKITRRNSEIMKRLTDDFIESMLIASSLIIFQIVRMRLFLYRNKYHNSRFFGNWNYNANSHSKERVGKPPTNSVPLKFEWLRLKFKVPIISVYFWWIPRFLEVIRPGLVIGYRGKFVRKARSFNWNVWKKGHFRNNIGIFVSFPAILDFISFRFYYICLLQ